MEAAAEPGQKVSVATVAKRLGELWKVLTDEEKQGYTPSYDLYYVSQSHANLMWNGRVRGGSCEGTDHVMRVLGTRIGS